MTGRAEGGKQTKINSYQLLQLSSRDGTPISTSTPPPFLMNTHLFSKVLQQMKELCTGPHTPHLQAPPTDPTHQPFPLTFGYHAMQVNDIVIVKLSHDSSFGEEVITSLLRGAVLRSEGQCDGMHAHAGAHPGMISHLQSLDGHPDWFGRLRLVPISHQHITKFTCGE